MLFGTFPKRAKEQTTLFINVLGLITLHLFSVSYFPNCRVHTNFGPQPTIITNYMHPAFNPYMLYILRGSFLYTKKHERYQKKKLRRVSFWERIHYYCMKFIYRDDYHCHHIDSCSHYRESTTCYDKMLR